MYNTMPIFEPMFSLALGLNRDLSSEPHCAVKYLAKEIEIEGKPVKKIGYKHYCCDPTLAPKGKSLIEILFTSDHAYWKSLSADHSAYKTEKEKTAQILITALDSVFPGIHNDIEMIDIATPLTYERYTGNLKGSFEGWMITPKSMMMSIKRKLPGLKNFYMGGQWLQPGGGITTSIKQGRDLIYILCHNDKKKFVTSEQ